MTKVLSSGLRQLNRVERWAPGYLRPIDALLDTARPCRTHLQTDVLTQVARQPATRPLVCKTIPLGSRVIWANAPESGLSELDSWSQHTDEHDESYCPSYYP